MDRVDEPWVIVYSDGTGMKGYSAEEWQSAPTEGVQAVVWFNPPARDKRRWTGVEDRQIWTGDDEYDPFGWGVKYGAYLSDEDYHEMMQWVFYGNY